MDEGAAERPPLRPPNGPESRVETGERPATCRRGYGVRVRRQTSPSSESPIQTAPPAAAAEAGPSPALRVAVTAFVAGSTIDTEPASMLGTHSSPFTQAVFSGFAPTLTRATT